MIQDEKLVLICQTDQTEDFKVHAYAFKKDENKAKLIAGEVPVYTCDVLKQEVELPKAISSPIFEPFILPIQEPIFNNELGDVENVSGIYDLSGGRTNELQALSQLGSETPDVIPHRNSFLELELPNEDNHQTNSQAQHSKRSEIDYLTPRTVGGVDTVQPDAIANISFVEDDFETREKSIDEISKQSRIEDGTP